MMHDLPTPAPSSDPPMPGSSPVKALKAGKLLESVKTRPFAPLDLNIVGSKAIAFQQAREQAGATPPPSSPPASSVFHSSPVAPTRQQALGFSPVKQQRPFSASVTPVRSTILDQTNTSVELAPTPASEQHAPNTQILGLISNPERDSDADAVPNLLFGSKSVSLVIGRSKPSGLPHASRAASAADIPASMQGLGSKRILRVNLPNEARHVSRIHAIVEWIPFVARPASNKKAVSPKASRNDPPTETRSSNGTFIVRIVGQNGLIVDGKRRREGQVLRLVSGKSMIDFFGVKCRFEHIPSTSDLQPSPVKSMQARVEEWSQRVTSPVKKRVIIEDLPSSETQIASSSPPASSPTGMLVMMSPSKRSALAKTSGRGLLDDEDDVTSSPTPVNRRGGGLVAGPLNIRQVRAGDSDQETGGNGLGAMDEDDDDEDESDDEDYVPAARPAPQNAVLVTRKPLADVVDDVSDSSSLSDLDSGIVDQQIGDSALATQPATTTPQAPRKRTETTGSASASKQAVTEALTESQTRMPPPAPVTSVRNAARRSASNSPAPSSPLPGASVQDLQMLARNCVRQLAPTYDLPGLLAGAIVFHRTATISASEAVRSVLTTTPGLMKGEAGEHSVAFSPSKRALPGSATLQHGCIVDGWPTASESNEKWASIARKAWREHLEVVLQSSAMFGVIQRAGKDASGNPLECWYYYDKENDPDKERAENLGVFAKPMRKALKGQKPIFWKRSGYARQQEELAEAKLQESASDVSASSASARKMEGESMDIASAPLPSSSVGNGRKRKAGQSQAETQGTGNDDEKRREKLRAKIAKSGLWDETQPEEKEEPTWDRKGDQDYRKGRK
ncbi:Forkhead-associated (FHA) domain protein [Kalmanozyma brasiliensis GHG001]|uniref:FHA domain-containing protein n=1 Tax=Kalmanozyma brasiliensis (strain GHG001) TaxID=1365824 RepID=V5GNX4_KALBG|nr:Forkhead-associated (FHA) domain protein [Kalmanozyma brasiliensis GHG001]EST07657.1 Forkhead-associated (FHA) domain protein [Kalmanozyma brasiliensis GHG001]